MSEKILLYFYASIAIIATAIIILSILLYNAKCTRAIKSKIHMFSAYLNIKNTSEISSFNEVLLRAYSRLQTYFRYQLICKVFGITSLLFNAFCFIPVETHYNGVYMPICAGISILSVIIIIYINPLDRARDYLISWRMWDEYISEILISATISKNKYQEKLLELPEKVKKDSEILMCDKT